MPLLRGMEEKTHLAHVEVAFPDGQASTDTHTVLWDNPRVMGLEIRTPGSLTHHLMTFLTYLTLFTFPAIRGFIEITCEKILQCREAPH